MLVEPVGHALLDVLGTLGHLQHGHGDGALLPVQVVAERLAGQGLPVVLHRQRGELLQVPGQLQRATHGEVGGRHVRRRLAGDVGGLDDRQQGVQVAGTCHHAGQLLRCTSLDEALVARQPLFAGRAFEQLVQAPGQLGHARGEVADVAGGVQIVAAAAQEPASGATAQAHQLIHQLQLQFGRHLVVQRLDLLPPVRQAEHVAHDDVGAGDVGRAHAGGLLQTLHEGDAHVVDQVVGDLRADDLALQAMTTHGLAELLGQLRREGGLHLASQVVVVRHQGFQQRFLEVDLAVGDQHRQLRPGQAATVGGAFVELVIAGQELQGTVQLAGGFQSRHQALVLGQALAGAALGQGQGLGLLVVVAQHQRTDRIGHLGQQLVALLAGHVAGGNDLAEENLDVHLVVGAVHTTGVVDEVGVAGAAVETVLDTPQLGHAEVAALAHHLGAQFAAVDAQAVVGLVADVGVGFLARLDVGTDAAVPQQVDRRLEQRVDQLGGRQLVGLDVEALLHLRGDGDALGAAQEDAAAFGDQLGVVVGPGRARQGEHALALDEAGGRIRVGVDEDVLVVERSDHLQLVRQQQAVAEHVAGHVADADHADLVLLHIDAALAEVALHADPAALGGDAHALVVVAGRAAGGEGVAEPEAVVQGDAVGDVGEGRGALVRRHHQVGIIRVVAYHAFRRHHLAFLEVVGDVEQAADKDAVAGDALGQHLVAVAADRQAARDEAALGAHRHDHRVLHLLRLDQAEHLGAEVLLAVGPAQAATGDVAEAQVHAFDARAVDEDLELRHRSRDVRDQARAELEAEVVLGLAVGTVLEEVGAQGGLDQVQVAPQDAVLVEHRNVVQRGEDGLFEPLLFVFQILGGQLARQVETGAEQAHQLLGDIGMVHQGRRDIAQVEAQADLLEVARVGAQQRHVAPGHRGGQHQAVEAVVLGRALDDADEGILQGLVELLDIDIDAFGGGEGEVVNPELAAIGAAQLVGEFAKHAQAEVLQDRQDIGQRQRRVGVVQLAVQLLLALGQRLVEAHHQLALIGQAEQVLHVDHRRVRGEALGVAGREAFREIGQHLGALGLAKAFDDQAGIVVLPRTAGLDDFLLQARRVDLHASRWVHLEDELHARQHRLGEVGPELAIAGLQALHEDLLDLHPRLGGIHVARHVGQAVGEAAVGVAAQEQAQFVALLDLHDGDGGIEQLVHRGLEQVVARQHFQYLLQLLAQVGLGIEARALDDLGHLAADIGDAADAVGVHRGGVQAHEAAFLDHLALGVQLADRHEVRVGRAVHAARRGGLGEGQQQRFAQVVQGLLLDVQLVLLQAGAQLFGQAEQRGLVIDQMAAVLLVDQGELLVAEESEVVVQQVFEEGLHLGQLGAIDLQLGLAQPGQQLLGLGLHRGEVGHRQAHLGQHFEQGLLQGTQLADIGAAVDLQVHQRFVLHLLAIAALAQQLLQLAALLALHAEHAVLQGVDAVAATVQLHAHRVDQERQVSVQHLDGGVGGLPAVLFVVGVVHAHQRLAIEAFEQAPGRKGAAGQVAKAALGQLIEGDDAEELLGEQGHLWQRLVADVLGQGRLQLMLEVGLAGSSEERHGDAPLVLLFVLGARRRASKQSRR